eukprot:11891424-Ditylum_brightwellii.AAC.1
MPSPNINSILIDPPHLIDNTEEDEEDSEEQSVTDNHNDNSNYKNPDDASKVQDQDTPPIQPSGMNFNLPIPVLNTMKQLDIFQV